MTLGVGSSELYTGVGFAPTGPEKLPREVADLSRVLEQEGFQLPSSADQARNWIAWIEHGVNLEDRGFLIDVASDPGLAAEKAVELLIDLIRKHGREIETANAALQ